jgi:hypothetical protein
MPPRGRAYRRGVKPAIEDSLFRALTQGRRMNPSRVGVRLSGTDVDEHDKSVRRILWQA